MAGDDKLSKDFWQSYSGDENNNQLGTAGGDDFVTPTVLEEIKAAKKEQAKEQEYDHGHPTREKVISILIIIGCLFALGAGYYFLNNSINAPIKYIMAVASSGGQVDTDAVKQELNRVLALKNTDTDGDKLSDYDELNVYKTSPYLEDSDGDGINDKLEIDQKTDPNCPGNQNCFRAANPDGTVNNSSDLSSSVLTQASISEQITSGNADAATVRQLLIQGGYPEADLQAMSDVDLLKMYKDIMAGGSVTAGAGTTGTSGAGTSGATGGAQAVTSGQPVDLSSLGISSIEDLKKLTGPQIRTLLLRQGAPADQLAAIPDDQLQSMFLSKLNTEISSQQNKQ